MMEQSENSDSSNNEYEVEAIEKDRQKRQYDPHKRKWVFVTEYLIKWVGYKRRSWEPEENLDNCGQLLNNYKKNKSKINNHNTDANNIYNKNNNIKNSNKTPVKFVTNKKNNINNNKAKREKEKELTDKKINDDDMTYNNINLYKPIYSDEEENKYSPMTSMNLNHSYFTSDYLKLDNDSYSSFLKKNDIKKKKENTNNNNLLSSSKDYDIDNEKYVSNVTNNNENNNENSYTNNENVSDFSDILQRFQATREESKEREKSIKINLLQKKRKLIQNYSEENSEHKENSDISISIDDPFIEMEKDSTSFFNTNDNSNSNSNNNNINGNNGLSKGNLELLEIRIPENKNDQIDLVWRDKEKNIVFKCTSKNTVMVPQGVIIDYYEKILKEYLNRKIIKIN